MKYKRLVIPVFTIVAVFLCAFQRDDKAEQRIAIVKNYQHALKNDPAAKWVYMADTVKQWFDDRLGTPTLLFKNKPASGKWKEWDEAMHANSWYDSIWYDQSDNTVKGYFFENNDFYELIGKTPTKTLRTFWFNNKDQVSEILIYWLPDENKPTADFLQPIVAWAQINDPAEIELLYPDGKLVPSADNALRWKRLLTKYRAVFPLHQ